MLLQPLWKMGSTCHASIRGKPGTINANISAKENALHIVIETTALELRMKRLQKPGLAIIRERLDLLSRKNKAEYSFKLESIEKWFNSWDTCFLILPTESEE